jgi:PAS domain S-box-containing protein
MEPSPTGTKAPNASFGYKAKEIIGKSILTLIPKDRQDEETEILGKIRRGQSIDHYETVRRCKDGRLIDVSLTISPVKGPNGEIVGVSKIARDITKQRQTELAFGRTDAAAGSLQRSDSRTRRAGPLSPIGTTARANCTAIRVRRRLAKSHTHCCARFIPSRSPIFAKNSSARTDGVANLRIPARTAGKLSSSAVGRSTAMRRESLLRSWKRILRLPIESAQNIERQSTSPSRESFQNLLL